MLLGRDPDVSTANAQFTLVGNRQHKQETNQVCTGNARGGCRER